MRNLVILGSTGSIGRQALEIVAAHPEEFRVIALAAGGSSLDLLYAQAREFHVPRIAIFDQGLSLDDAPCDAIAGAEAIQEIAALRADLVINGITGSIGLGPTLAALTAGNTVALANKESLVAGGELVRSLLDEVGRDHLLPIDSEHSALFQSMHSGKRNEIAKVILTASGGPFREREDLSRVTVRDALAHPTWSMGQVVTINSATLVNKGLEIIEAHYLFDLPYTKIDAVIHPQSVIHSMVEFIDGSTIAQASPPDMKGPISYAMGWPNRVRGAMRAIDWTTSHQWQFAPIDERRFPAVALARHVGELGGCATAIYNAANEVAVAAFLAEELPFVQIVPVIEKVVESMGSETKNRVRSLEDVIDIENDARLRARTLIGAKR